MTDYANMSIDHLTDYRNQWPAQQSEWTRAELVLQKRRAVRDALLDLAEELRDEGLALLPCHLLEVVETALIDWLHIYAPEHCHEARVAEAQSRVYANGTLAYIGDTIQAVRNAGAMLPEAAQ